MIERVIFTPEADDDVAQSCDWYESREPGLGEDFLRCIEACIHGVQRHPEIYPVAIDGFVAHRFVAFHSRFSTKRLLSVSRFILYSTVHKTRRSGASVLAIEPHKPNNTCEVI